MNLLVKVEPSALPEQIFSEEKFASWRILLLLMSELQAHNLFVIVEPSALL